LGIAVVALLTQVEQSWPMVRGKEPDEKDRRFDACCAFSLTAWLTEKEDSHNHFGNGTLVKPNVVVIARHLLPGQDGNKVRIGDKDYAPPKAGTYVVRFRRTPDGKLGKIADGSSSFHHVKVKEWVISPRADVALAILEEDVKHIEPIPVSVSDVPEKDAPIILAGWGKEGEKANEGPRGRLLLAYTKVIAARDTFIGFPSAVSQDKTVSGPNMFDSGSGIFIEEKEKLRLIGVISTYTGGANLAQFKDDEAFKIMLPDAKPKSE
jgi:hypothetical protein